MAFTLNRKNGEPFYGKVTHSNTDAQETTEEVQSTPETESETTGGEQPTGQNTQSSEAAAVENAIEQHPIEAQNALENMPGVLAETKEEAAQVTNGNPKDSEVRNDVVEKQLKADPSFSRDFFRNIFIDKTSQSEEERLLGDANTFVDTKEASYRNDTDPIYSRQKPQSQVHTKKDENNPDSVSLSEEERLLGNEYVIKPGEKTQDYVKRILWPTIHGKVFGDFSQAFNLDQLVPEHKRISFDEAKDIIPTLKSGPTPTTKEANFGQRGISTNLQDEAPSYSTGHEITLPSTDTATSSTTAKLSPTTQLLRNIMSGKVDTSIAQNKKGIDTHHRAMPNTKGKQKKEALKMSPLKASTKAVLTQQKQNLTERIIDKVMKNYKNWPKDQDGYRVFEEGLIAFYVKKDEIKIKFGSYRQVLFETFAKEHPELLQQIFQALQ